MVVQLPEDVFHIVCEQLYQLEDLSTLFNVAVCSKHLAPLALASLYRMQKGAGPSEDESVGYDANSLLAVQKWSVAWRSLILSALDRTLYPYCRYLRVLDMRDFRSLMEDPRFADKIANVFFAGELTPFYRVREWTNLRGQKRKALDATAIIEAVGDVLSPKTSMVEQLSGEFGPEAFGRWIPNMPRLQRLELWSGDPLAFSENHQAIYSACPNFDSISIYRWAAVNADRHIGRFLAGLPSQSLKSFVTLGECGVFENTCSALCCHSDSLTELHLCFSPETLSSMASLRGCTSVEKLKLEMPSSIDLEETQNDVYCGLKEWLRQCVRLKSVELIDFKCAAGLLTPLLTNEAARIEELSVSTSGLGTASYMLKDNMAFHRALGNHRHLRALDLNGDADESTRDDIDALVESLGKLTDLRHLKLRGISDYFSDDSIIALLCSLPRLHEVYVSGLSSTDNILEIIPSSLPNLRNVTFAAENSTFTADGLMALASRLGPGNTGLEINIPLAEPMALIPERELKLVREALSEAVGGRLEYQATRDPDVPEYVGSDPE